MKRFKSILIAITMISTLTISPLQNVKTKTDIDTAFNGDSADLSTGISPNPNADYDWQAEVCTAGTGAALGFRVTAYVCDDESTLNEISHNTNLKSWIQDSNNRNRFANILSSSSGLCFYMFNKQKDIKTLKEHLTKVY